ncbi:MAG: hypothetical protein ABFD49_01335 [Armatimonadota bacterium]|nr:hypothetical protein [bacterium]
MKTRLLVILATITLFQIIGCAAFAADVQVAGNVVVEKGKTAEDAVAVLGNVTVKGHVTGDAVAVAGNVIVEPGGVVDGNAVAVGGNVIRHGNSVVKGETTVVGAFSVHTWDFKPWVNIGFLPKPLPRIILMIVIAALAALVTALFPSKMELVAESVLEQPGRSVLYGLIWIFLAPTIVMIFVMTVVGIPLAVLLVLLVIAAAIVAGVCAGLAVGRRVGMALNKPIASPVLAAFIGVLLLELVKLVPIIGCLLVFILQGMAFGAVVMTGFGTNQNWFANLFQRRGPAPTLPPTPPAGSGGNAE